LYGSFCRAFFIFIFEGFRFGTGGKSAKCFVKPAVVKPQIFPIIYPNGKFTKKCEKTLVTRCKMV